MRCQRAVCAASQKIKGLTHLVCIAVLEQEKEIVYIKVLA